MKKLKYRDKIIEYKLKEQDHKCLICNKHFLEDGIGPDPHHRLHDWEYNRNSFPNLIDSIFNICLLHRGCHNCDPGFRSITLVEAEKLEKYLVKFNEVSIFVNTLNTNDLYKLIKQIERMYIIFKEIGYENDNFDYLVEYVTRM